MKEDNNLNPFQNNVPFKAFSGNGIDEDIQSPFFGQND